MNSFWNNALKVGGTFVVGAYILYNLFKALLKLPVFSKISPEHTFYLFLVILVLTFGTLILSWIAFIKKKPDRQKVSENAKSRGNKNTLHKTPIVYDKITSQNNGKFEIAFRCENIDSEKDIEVKHGGIVHWSEKDTDAFWIKLFVKKNSVDTWPKIRISSSYKLFEVRDYSHMFFSGDNQMSSELLPDLSKFKSDGIITYNVFEPEKGQETDQFCNAELKAIECAPARVKIERSLDNVFNIEPYEFLNGNKINHSQIGIWIVCRSEKFIKDAPNRIDFKIKSNFPFEFLKNQFILPARSFIEESKCKVTDNYFKPWTNSNQIVGQPGWISLIDALTSEPKHISSFYNIEKPFYTGGGILEFSSKDVRIDKLIVFKNRVSFNLFSDKIVNVEFSPESYLIILILIAYNREAISKPLIESSLLNFVNLANKAINKSRKRIKLEDFHQLVNSINRLLNEELASYLDTNGINECIAGKNHKYYAFPLLSKHLKDFEDIDIEPVMNEYNIVSKLLSTN